MATSPVVKTRLESLELDLDNVPTLISNTVASIQTASRDAEERIKKEVKVHVQHKVEELTDSIHSLSSKVATMEAAGLTKLVRSLQQKVAALEDDNRKMKAEVSALRQELSKSKADMASATCDLPSPPHTQDPATGPIKTLPPSTPPPSPSKNPGIVQNNNNTTSPPVSINSPVQSPPSRSNPPGPQSNSPSPSNQSGKTSHLLERLKAHAIVPDATRLLLGDSVIRGIDMRRSAPAADITQKVCVPGVKVSDLTAWLRDQQPSAVMTHVTCHVGINDCKDTVVTATAWKAFLHQCKKTFPHASLTASSIVPPKGQQGGIHKNASVSNTHLRAVCKQLRVRCVDHTPTFTAPSGAPKLALYKDPLHPSPKGTARLAENLFPTSQQAGQGQNRPPRNYTYQDYPPLSHNPITSPRAKTPHNPSSYYANPVSRSYSQAHYPPSHDYTRALPSRPLRGAENNDYEDKGFPHPVQFYPPVPRRRLPNTAPCFDYQLCEERDINSYNTAYANVWPQFLRPQNAGYY